MDETTQHNGPESKRMGVWSTLLGYFQGPSAHKWEFPKIRRPSIDPEQYCRVRIMITKTATKRNPISRNSHSAPMIIL